MWFVIDFRLLRINTVWHGMLKRTSDFYRHGSRNTEGLNKSNSITTL